MKNRENLLEIEEIETLFWLLKLLDEKHDLETVSIWLGDTFGIVVTSDIYDEESLRSIINTLYKDIIKKIACEVSNV